MMTAGAPRGSPAQPGKEQDQYGTLRVYAPDLHRGARLPAWSCSAVALAPPEGDGAVTQPELGWAPTGPLPQRRGDWIHFPTSPRGSLNTTQTKEHLEDAINAITTA